MPAYSFLTTWVLEAERERVWDALHDSETWPEWWPAVVRTERLADGDADGTGQRGGYVWRARLPYRVAFEVTSTRVERPHALEGEARGALAGNGRWLLFEERGRGPAVTVVVFAWDVRTTKPWMNVLAPLARPIFARNHDWVMRGGATGLARRLDAPLLHPRI